MLAQHFRVEFNREILLKNVTEIQENFGWEIRLQLEGVRPYHFCSNERRPHSKRRDFIRITWLQCDQSLTAMIGCHETRSHPTYTPGVRFLPMHLANGASQY